MVAIVPRAQWGARPARSRQRIALPTPRLWVHHTAGSERGAAGMRLIQNYHMNVKRWVDIAYSFVVDNDTGTIYEGRGLAISGAHTEGDNSRSHAICVMGNFEHEQPTARALASIVALARHGRDRGWWVPTLGGHRDAPGASTACPGRHLYARLPDLRRRLTQPAPVPQEDDDMTPDQERLLRQAAMDAAAARLYAKAAFDLANPNGYVHALPATGELVAKGTPGAKPVGDVWRWARESVLADRQDDARHSEVLDLLEDLYTDSEDQDPDVDDLDT